MFFTKTKCLFFALMIICLCFCGCSFKKEVGQNDSELVFWTMQLSPVFDDFFKKTIAEFEEKHPGVKIKWVDIPYNDMENKLMATMASASLPDIMNLHTQLTKKLSQYDMLLNMDKSAFDVKGNYLQSAWETSQIKGASYALPWYLATALTYYNKELVSLAGLGKVPESYVEALEMARIVKNKTGKYGMTFPFADIEMIGHFQKLDPNLFDETYTKINLHSDTFKAAAKYFRTLYQEGLVPKDSLMNNNADEIKLYSAGEIALFSSGTSTIRNIKENGLDIYNATGVTNLLQGAKKDNKIEMAVMNIAVANNGKNEKMALEFAKFITSPEKQTEFCKLALAVIPSTKASLSEKFFTESDGTPIGDARMVSTREVKKDLFKLTPIEDWSVLKEEFVPALQKFISAKEEDFSVFVLAEEKINEVLKKR